MSCMHDVNRLCSLFTLQLAYEKDVGMGLCTFNFVSIPTPCLLAFWHFIPTSF